MADIKVTNPGSERSRERDHDDDHHATTILKFSGVPQAGSGSVVSFLVDDGPVVASLDASSYPIAGRLRARSVAVNLLGGVTPPPGATLVLQLFKNGVGVPGFAVTYEPGQTGVQIVRASASFEPGDTLDLAAIATGFSGSEVGAISASIEGESTDQRHR